MTARAALRLSAVILLAALSAPLIAVTPASAHTTLKQSDPAADANVPVLPEVVRLTFSDTLPIVPKVTVRDSDGTEVNSSPVSPRGNTVLQPVKSAKAGRFTVTWELTSSDGHKSTGSFAFTVATAAAPPSASSAASAASPGSSAAASPTAPVVALVSPSPAAAAPSNAAQSSDSAASGLLWTVVIVLLAAVAAGAVFVLRRRRR